MDRRNVSGVLALAGFLVAAGTVAASTFQVMIDSKSLAGQPGKIALDLTNPDPAENTVTINTPTFTGGGGITAKETSGGQTTGGLFDNMPNEATIIQDFAIASGGVRRAEFYTNLTLDVTWGASVSFTVDVSENATPGAIPDLFALYLLNPTTGQPLYATGDPLGTGAVFAVAITTDGACLFLPTAAGVPVTLVVNNEIGQAFTSCVQGGLNLGRSSLTFARKAGRDQFAVNATFLTTVPIDPLVPTDGFFLARGGVRLLNAQGLTLKAKGKPRPGKKTTYTGKGGGVRRLTLTTKDQQTWRLQVSGAKVDLSAANTGTDETIALGLESHTPAISGGKPGQGTFVGSGTFKRKRTQLKFPK
jgi:hypothetical protein